MNPPLVDDGILGAMRLLLQKLGNPELKVAPVIHVAGTNGKGSTIAFMASILRAAGLRVHVYTSPHLFHHTERICLNGTPIEIDQFEKYRQKVRCLAPQDISFFQEMTAIAFLAFSEHPADVILLETGIGGRLDPTNLVPNPAVCVITPLSYDHQDYLGGSIEEIAREKAGIIKKGAQVVIAPQEYPIEEILYKKIDDVGAYLSCDLSTDERELAGLLPQHLNEDTMPGMLGLYQPMNAKTAVSAVLGLRKRIEFPLTQSIVAEGLRNTRWLGRMQLMSEDPEVWVDGAHNEGGFRKLREQLILWKQQDERPIYAVVAMLSNRDPKILLRNLEGYVDKIYALKIKDSPSKHEQFHSPEIFDILMTSEGQFPVECIMLTWEELQKIMKKERKNPRYIVTGSLYLVSKVFYGNSGA